MGFDIKSHFAKSGSEGESRRVFDLSEDLPDACNGFKIELSHISRRQIQKWTQQCTKLVRNSATKKKEPKLDNDALFRLYAKHVVRGWTGLTVGGLKQLIRLKDVQTVPEDLEVECSEENVVMLLSNALDLDEIVTNLAIDPANFTERGPSTDEEEAEEDEFRG